MDKLGDIELFVTVVKQNGLAAAGRKLSMSPATVTARLKRLESTYDVRLLTRTTRQIALTDEGNIFYQHCLEILNQVNKADELLYNAREEPQGSLRITATIDLGKQRVAPVLAEFVKAHPKVTAHLNLVDDVVDLIDRDFDLAVRYGGLEDNRMVASKLADNYRVMFASPAYLKKHGTPKTPKDLANHVRLSLGGEDKSLDTWFFNHNGVITSIPIDPIMTTNDGSLIREWAIAGLGIVLKSYWDIKDDLETGRLISILGDYKPDYWPNTDPDRSNLYIVYPSKDYLPNRTRAFIDFLKKRFSE